MEFENIIKLINTVSESNLTSFEYEEDDVKIKLGAEKKVIIQSESVDYVKHSNISPIEISSEQTKSTEIDGNVVKSPLVGTFYNSASPDDAPFVSIGDTVKKGQTLGIIEAMKLMNDIECEFDGVVVEILVNNEEVVEYGQPLFVIK